MEHEVKEELRLHLTSIETGLRGNLFALDAFAAFLGAGEQVGRSEFQSFATSLLRSHGGIQAIGWVPRVAGDERPAFEEKARRDGISEGGIAERDGQGRTVAAAERGEYFPIHYVEPAASDASSLLLDLGSPQARLATLPEARDTGEARAVDTILLPRQPEDRQGFTVLRPVYRQGTQPRTIEERRRDLAGFAVTVLRVGDIVRRSMAPLHSVSPDQGHMEVRIFDMAAPAGQRLLYPKGEADGDPASHGSDLRVERSFDAAGRPWLLVAWPTAAHGRLGTSALPWMVLAAGLVATILVAGFVRMKVRRAAERVAAEQALRQGERLLRSILDNSPNEITLKNADGRYVIANAAALKHWGIGKERRSGDPLPDLSPTAPEHRRAAAEHEWEVIESQSPIAKEREWPDPAGKPQTHIVTKFPILDDGGKVVWIGSISTDITALKQVERELRDRNRAYRTLSRCNEILVRSEDEEALIADVCRTIVETGGYAGAEVGIAENGGRGALRSVARCGRVPDAANILQIPWDGPACPIVAAVTAQATGNEEAGGVKSMATFPMFTGGRAVGVLAVCSDMHGTFGREAVALLEELAGDMAFGIAALRAKAQHEKAAVEMRKLARAVEQSPAMIIMTDAQGTIEYVNPKFVEVSGYSAAEAVGAKPSLLQSGETERGDYESLWAAIKDGRVWRGLFHNKRKDGSLFWGESAISPVFDGDGGITHFIGIQEDVTERLEQERRLRHADKMDSLGNLAGGIAHDFNNMLLPIGTLTAMVLKDMEPGSKGQRRLERVLEATERAQSLAQRILAFGRTDSGEVQTHGISESILETANLLKSTLPKTIALDVRIEADLGDVAYDRTQIETVVLNLAKNAADAMGRRPGDLRIALERFHLAVPLTGLTSTIAAGSYARLTIGDTGKGIEPDKLARIFEPYFTTKAKGEGTGLGLAMVRTIILKHGGEIAVESEVGVGTTFRIYLPLHEAGRSASAEGTSAASEAAD
ncbi:MAG: CHASE domain-containing protein [Rhodospirillales bacterium]|nr:CHASE domain-containing protein [Rhodospirillales bacterium]